jgi:hypothetical protein
MVMPAPVCAGTGLTTRSTEDHMAISQGTQLPPPNWAAPTAPTPAAATTSWRSGIAWMAGDRFCYRAANGSDPSIPLNMIDNILISDESYKKTPGWAVVLAVLLFPIGLLFLMSKDDVPRSRITIYVKGSPTPLTMWLEVPVGQAQAEWYPLLRRIGR